MAKDHSKEALAEYHDTVLRMGGPKQYWAKDNVVLSWKYANKNYLILHIVPLNTCLVKPIKDFVGAKLSSSFNEALKLYLLYS